MTENLKEVKDKLYRAFDKALEHAESSMSSGDNFEKTGARAQALQAAAQTAQAIATVEHEIAVLDLIRDAKERGDNIVIEVGRGIGDNVKPLTPLKLRPSNGS
jgi:hypothetical protein